MAIKNLTTAEMIAISATWLTPDGRKLLGSVETLAGLVSRVEKAHKALVHAQPRTADNSALVAIQDEQAAVDVVHDRKVRGLHLVLTGLSELADTRAEVKTYLLLRDRLFPQGLGETTHASYEGEIGTAKSVGARLDKDDEKTLKGKLPNGRSLEKEVEAWTGAALHLEKLEAKRRDTEAELKKATTGRAPLLAARNGWIAVVNALISNLALDGVASTETSDRILGVLRKAEAKADRRGGSSEPTGPTPTPPAAPSTGTAST